MTGSRVVIGGELHLSLETVAHCYHVEVAWLYRVYELGLIGRGRSRGRTVVIAARKLDRVAQIVRLHFHHGLDLPALAMILDLEEEP